MPAAAKGKMQKIVIDTNIIVSSLIQRGYSNQIINELFIEKAECITLGNLKQNLEFII